MLLKKYSNQTGSKILYLILGIFLLFTFLETNSSFLYAQEKSSSSTETNYFLELVKNRHSVRSYQEKEIPKELLEKILYAANRAPSAGNLQAYHIFVVQDKNLKEKLSQAALSQPHVASAPVVLVFCAEPERSEVKYKARGKDLYCLQDATIAASYAQLAVSSLGLSCCWVGAFDPEGVSKALSLEKKYYPVCLMPLGYAAESPRPTDRRDLSEVVTYLPSSTKPLKSD